METKVEQTSVSFSDSHSNVEDKARSWFRRPFFQDDDDDVPIDDEHAAAVAAAATAINSMEEGELIHLQKRREKGRAQTMRRKEDTISARSSETSRKKSSGGDIRRVESQNGVATPKPISPAAGNQNQNGKTRADAWERSKTERIQKRYEKMKFQIVAWENEKKMEVKLKMERKKKALEQKRALLMQHYQNKIARIDMIAEGARAQLEERRRKEESEVREKAKKIRATGETSRKKSSGGDIRRVESQNGVATPKPISPAAGNQNQNGKIRADAWERSKTERIQKRYEKIKFQIVAWENEKKMEVKLKMERKKKALEQKRALLMQHYQNKIARIDMIAEGARAQLEERRRKEESEVREKAKKIRATGTVPVKYCFCFNCC